MVSHEVELGLVGSLLRYPDKVPDALHVLREEYFGCWPARIVFKALAGLWEARKAIDLVTVANWLTKAGLISELEAGGRAPHLFLVDLWEKAKVNTDEYPAIVRDSYVLRRMQEIADSIKVGAQTPGSAIPELLDKAERQLFQLAQVGEDGAAVDYDAALYKTRDYLDHRIANKVTGLPSGFPDLDNLTAGWHESELTIVAARPSVGKTSFGLNIVRHIATMGVPVFFASLEQSCTELIGRLLCDLGDVSTNKYRHMDLNDDDLARIVRASDQSAGRTPIHFDDSPRQSMLRIVGTARRLKMSKGIRLVVVDYLQLIEPANKRDPRHEQVAVISRRLKEMARELKVPVVAMAQLSRSAEEHTKPKLSDLRESGAIEQDADCVVALWRPKENDPTQVGCSVLKQRNGPTGNFMLQFEPRYMRFSNPSQLPAV